MVIEEKLIDKIQRTDRKLLELFVHMQEFNREYQKILKELATTPEQLEHFVENPSNFSPPIWEQLQKEKKEREERLNRELNNVRDANKIKNTIAERGKVQQHWLFVR